MPLLFQFGKKKKSKISKKPSKALIARCKKYSIKLTIKRGNKRVPKSVSVLTRQCAAKKRGTKNTKNTKGSVTRVTKQEKWWTDKQYNLTKADQAMMTRAYRKLKDERKAKMSM
jgi:hypothetical protein